jgi:hypothetical protein
MTYTVRNSDHKYLCASMEQIPSWEANSSSVLCYTVHVPTVNIWYINNINI